MKKRKEKAQRRKEKNERGANKKSPMMGRKESKVEPEREKEDSIMALDLGFGLSDEEQLPAAKVEYSTSNRSHLGDAALKTSVSRLKRKKKAL